MKRSVILATSMGAPLFIAVIVLAGVCAVLALTGGAPPFVAAMALLLLIATIAIGVAVQSSGIFARPVLRAQTGRPQIALTFDDGPHPIWTRPLLDLLESRGHRGTFFVVGDRAAQNVGLLAEMARRGHEIANHTWRHSYRTVMVHPRVLAGELERVNALLEQATGARPRWFRPPVGLLSPRIAPALRSAGLRLVAWTASARDGVRSTTVQQAFSRLEGELRPGAILVLHDAPLHGDAEPCAISVVALLLNRMETLGLTSVTLSDLCAESHPTHAPVPLVELAPAKSPGNLELLVPASPDAVSE